MRGLCAKLAITTGVLTGCALDGTDPPIIMVLTVLTMILVIITLGGKE